MRITFRHSPAALAALMLIAGSAGPLLAAGRVQLEIVADRHAALTASQEWIRALGAAGVQNIRIRQARPTDTVGIQVGGTEKEPVYVVTAALTARNELALPGGRYQRRDAARLARWLQDLAENGPPENRPKKSAFGLLAKQFQQVRADLARPVAFSTKDMDRAEVLRTIARRLHAPIELPPEADRALRGDKVAEELAGLSSGTAIACVLRPMGYSMVPRAGAGGQVAYAVLRARPGMEIWPIGWAPEKPRREVLPALYEFLNVNGQGVTAATALEEIAKRLKVPYLVDHNALVRHGIDPAKVQVSLPQGRTFYSKLLQRVLFQAKLKSELRTDEAGKPFLWITSIKPL
jgi:hypothetical protein